MIPEAVQKCTQTKCFEKFDEKYPEMSRDWLLLSQIADFHLENKIVKQLFMFGRGYLEP